MSSNEVLVRTYAGANQPEAATRYGEDAVELAADGWVATSQAWVETDWPRTAYLIAAILILAGGIGIVMLIVMFFVKPKRTLMVTYGRPATRTEPSE